MLRVLLAAAVVLATTGCASIVNETTHPIRVETAKEDGSLVAGAECKLDGEYGSFSVKSGDTLQLRRSSKDMDISCKAADNAEAKGRLISRANAGLAGNIIFGGIIGAVIDHNKGTAYTFPTWIRLVFGKTLVFDRNAEKDGGPVLGAPVEEKK